MGRPFLQILGCVYSGDVLDFFDFWIFGFLDFFDKIGLDKNNIFS
jgi:hypothetical protein